MYAFSLLCVKNHYASQCTLAIYSSSFLVFLLYYKSGACFWEITFRYNTPCVRVCLSPFHQLLPSYTRTLISPMDWGGLTEASPQHVGTFSSSFIRDPVFHPIDDCEHPLLYLPDTDIASQESYIRVLSGSCQQNLSCILNVNEANI